MINKLKNLFNLASNVENSDLPEQKLALAAAALLVEVMVIDKHLDDTEEEAIKKLLTEQFYITPDELEELFIEARKEVDQATSLFQFTRVINDNFSAEQKFQLTVNLWKIAFADGNLDKYEEHIIRRIADLIHLPHSEFIRAKKCAQ